MLRLATWISASVGCGPLVIYPFSLLCPLLLLLSPPLLLSLSPPPPLCWRLGSRPQLADRPEFGAEPPLELLLLLWGPELLL